MTNSSDIVIDWYKNAVIYGVDIKTFRDGNKDGVGDFVGLTQKLDYIKDLGVTVLWLLPFYPSSYRDNGYDVTDYYNIDPRFGTLAEFKKFIKEAKKRGLRVIIDLVFHHTSDQHPWFLEAKKNKKSKYYHYYIWTKKIPEKLPENAKPAFPGIEPGVWKYEPAAKEFYYHWFYRFQPNLNIRNPEVQKEICTIMEFWLKLGVSGFRVDAATKMFEIKGVPGTEIENPGLFMEDLTRFVKKFNDEAVLLAEADVEAHQVELFFGQGQRMQLLYNFLLNRYIFLSLATKNAGPMRECLATLPQPSTDGQWVNFLRNLDELNLEQLRPEEKRRVFEEFAPDQNMQIYNRGIRRRLAPMFNGDFRRIKMSYSLLFSLPGAIIVSYGDEIGMGDNLALPERDSVRSPMQWTSGINGGFSEAHPSALYRDVIKDGPYRFDKLNAYAQIRDEGSLYYGIKEMIQIRRQHEEIGKGFYKIVQVDQQSVFAIAYTLEGKLLIILNNLSEEGCKVALPEYRDTLLKEIYSDGVYQKEEKADSISLHGYGFRWFEIKREGVKEE